MIKLQMFFKVSSEKNEAFEQMYKDNYVPALRKQEGYVGSMLLRLFPQEVAKEISAAATDYNYQMELIFDTEAQRRKWVDSPEHKIAWPIASSIANSYEWRGYDVVSSDQAAVPLLMQNAKSQSEQGINMAYSSQEIKLDIWDEKVKQLVSPTARLELLAKGFQFIEGPVWDNIRGCVFFSDIPGNTMYRYTLDGKVGVYRKPSNYSNGSTFDRGGRLLSCEHHTRRLVRERGEKLETIVDSYKGKKLNSPNDLIVAGDGSILFTDPAYGLQEGLGGPAKAELDFKGLYRVPPAGGEAILLASDFEAPNGLVLSPDESKLYVVDSLRKHIRLFNIGAGWKISGGKVFFEVKDEGDEIPDGMKIDVDGNFFCTGPKGIWIFSRKGKQLGRIHLPEVAANLNWGGYNRDTLYVTASTGLYRLSTLTKG